MNITTHTDRRRAYYKRREHEAWGRGFIIGILFACALIAAFLIGQERAYGANRQALPPHVDTWLAIAKCEQPKPGGYGKWGSVHWHQTHNYSFPGGAGMQTVLWRAHRRPHMRHLATMDQASPIEQTWAMYRFWLWAERTYPGYGWTGWDCSKQIGWTTSNPADALR